MRLETTKEMNWEKNKSSNDAVFGREEAVADSRPTG